jgi:hypothetical protein
VAAVEQLAFERGEKALADRIVEAITDRTHRKPHPSLPAPSLSQMAKLNFPIERKTNSPAFDDGAEHGFGKQLVTAESADSHGPAGRSKPAK